MPIGSEDGEVDFFVSYTGVDAPWAEWIAWTLEKDGGYSTLIQAWDIAVGENFVLAMHKAARRAKRVIMVCSPDYLDRQYTAPEWAAIWRTDPQGAKASVVPVVVRACELDGLLGPLVRINLVGLDQDAAGEALLAGVSFKAGTRPTTMPAFPGRASVASIAPVAPVKIEPRFPASPPVTKPVTKPVPETRAPEKPALRWELFEGEPPTVSRVAELVSPGAWTEGGPRLELHMLPEQASPLDGRNSTDLGFRLIESGRRHALFGLAAAVDLQQNARCIAAVTSSVPCHLASGLALSRDGQRSVWRSAPILSLAEWAASRESLNEAVADLLAILLSLGSPLADRVTFALGIVLKTNEKRESAIWLDPLRWIIYKAAADDPAGVAQWLTERVMSAGIVVP